MSSIVEKAINAWAKRNGLDEKKAKEMFNKAQTAISPSGKVVDDKQKEAKLSYDSFGEGLEPAYFWIIDFMGDKPGGLGFEVKKTREGFESSVGSAFFGEMGTKASVMQDRAIKLLGMINTVVRSIMNILYDLKEFEIRLEFYRNLNSDKEEIKKDARLGLKQIWLPKV